MPSLPLAPIHLRQAARIALSSYVTNGLVTAGGVLLVSAVVHSLLGPLAAATAAVGAIVVSPPDQVAPRRGKLAHLLPAGVVGIPLFYAVQMLRAEPIALWALLVLATFVAFLGAAWGKRGIPVSIAVMFSMVFSLAAQPLDGPGGALHSTSHFALGVALYLVYSVAANAALNARYRVLTLADALLAVARLMRTQSRQFVSDASEAQFLGRLINKQAALADQLQAARNILLESPRTTRRQQLAAMLMQILDMRDHLLACALDLDAVKADPAQCGLLATLGAEIEALAGEIEALADALLLGRRPDPFHRPAIAPDTETSLLARALAGRVNHIVDETERLVLLARGERDPDLAVVRSAWQLFVSPTRWSWKPFLQLWRWDAPPLRHAIRGALAIGVGQAVSIALPWGTHDYWILLTIVVVLRGSLAQTLERRNSRVAGTLVGCLLAGLLLSTHPHPVLLVAVVTLMQGIAHAFAVQRYLVTAVAATVLALVQAHLLNTGVAPVFELAERVGDTLIGVAIAWVFSYVLPSWERGQVPALVDRVLAAQRRHAQHALGLGQLTAVDNQAELEWRLARREVYDSVSALAQAAQRALAEPRAVQPPLRTLERLLAYSYQLLAQLTAVKTMLLQRRDRLRADEIRSPLQEAAGAIAAVLDGKPAAQVVHATPVVEEISDLPDPFERDLSPWLLRRLQLAVEVAQGLRAEAVRAKG